MKLFLTRLRSFRYALCGVFAVFLSGFLMGCPSAPTQPAVRLLGTWRWTSTFAVLSSTGTGCPMGQGESKIDTITIDDGSGNVVLAGFLGQVTNVLYGNVSTGTNGSLEEINFHGIYSQNSGTTTIDSTSVVSVESATSLMGDESWSWARAGGTCSGHASITATKL